MKPIDFSKIFKEWKYTKIVGDVGEMPMAIKVRETTRERFLPLGEFKDDKNLESER